VCTMSFQVRAGASPQQHHSTPSQQPSAVSPGLSFRGHHSGNPPPMNLAADNGLNSGNNSTTEAPSAANGSKRIGTDPSKYKTTICRNWEQMGSCSFRGCTFAHGVDDLRPPTRGNASPPLPPQQSPPLAPSSMYTSPSGTSGNGLKIEQLLEMLVVEIQRERDMVGVHAEANKTLESMLRREQVQNVELQGKVDALQNQAMELARQVKERNAELLNLLGIAGSSLTLEQRHKVESLASWNFGHSHATPSTSGSAEKYQDASGSDTNFPMGPTSRRIPLSADTNGLRHGAPVWVPQSSSAASDVVVSSKELTLDVSSPTSETKHLRDLLEQLRK